MTNTQIVEKKEQKSKYIPVISFLLTAPVGVASAFLAGGTLEKFASLNEAIISKIIPEASARWSCIPGPRGNVSFANNNTRWVKSGTVNVSDCDCNCRWINDDCGDDDGDDDDGA